MGKVVIREGTADHHLGHPLLVNVVDFSAANQLSVAKHKIGFANFKNLRHLVGNVDEANALLLQLAHDDEQVFDFPVGQRRRRLVHNNQVALKQKRPGDLHQLLFGGL